MEVVLLRHAQTAGNLERRYIGRTDEPLCPEGVREAIRTGVFPSVPLVHASPMIRCIQTASIKFPSARIVTSNNLREMDFGHFEGRSADEMKDDEDYMAWVEGECLGQCPGGESRISFVTRSCVAFSEIVGESLRMRRNYVVIVAHGGTIMGIMERFARPGRQYFGWQVKNCSGFRAQLDDDIWAHRPQLVDISRI
ncbi:MAG: histidine phosphatase family protein [Clostridiales bacterium]|nr:histidine phosphatase family protein [Clostridiales bacterium]